MSHPKNKSVPIEEIDLPVDREQKLSTSFEDPNLTDLMPDILAEPESYGSLPTITEEAVAAVEELVLEFGAEEAEPFAIEPFEQLEKTPLQGTLELPEACEFAMPIQAGLDVTSEANRLHADKHSMADSAVAITRSRVGELFFDLVACEMPFNELVNSLLTLLVQATGAQVGSILEHDRQNNEFFFRASYGGNDPERVKAFRVPCHKGIVGFVAESREALYLKDMANDQRQLLAISMSTGLETKSCVAAPIILGGELYGVVELFNSTSGDYFTEQDFAAFQRGVRMAAKVLEIRFLMAELARRAA